MKIVILHRNSFDKVGGVESTIYYISKKLVELQHEVVIIARESKEDYRNEEQTDVAKILRYKRHKIPKIFLLLAPIFMRREISKQLPEILKKETPDLIISRDNILTFLAKEKYGECPVTNIPPVVINFYNSRIRKSKGLRENLVHTIRYFQLKIEACYQKKSYKTSSNIVVFSENMEKQLSELVNRTFCNKTYVMHPGVDDKFSFSKLPNREIHEEYNIPLDYKIVLFIGRIVQEKNLRMLIKAFSKINEKSVLVIVGHGDDIINLKDLVNSLKINEKVIFTGNRRDVERFYKSASISVVPSVYEAFGNVIAESLSCGTPVVGFKSFPPKVRTAIEELVIDGKTGFIVKEFSEDALQKTLEKALLFCCNSGLYIDMRRECSNFSERKFNWSKFVREIIEMSKLFRIGEKR